MKKILIPCDFSKPAINAFRYALDLALPSKGTIHLLHVIELPILHDSIIMPVLSFEEQLLKDLKEKAESELNKIISKFNKEGVRIVTRIEFGAPYKLIKQYAEDNAVDVILMGSHGSSGMKEYFIGSNVEKIVRHATVPVLVLKDYYKGPITDIVFPTSLEIDDQEELIKRVKLLQSYFKARIHIVWINTPVNFTSDSVTFEKLNAFAKRFMFKDYTINAYNHIEAELGILEFTKSVKANLIVMGTHGRRGLSHLVAGSLTESVVNRAKVMVWSYLMQEEPVEA